MGCCQDILIAKLPKLSNQQLEIHRVIIHSKDPQRKTLRKFLVQLTQIRILTFSGGCNGCGFRQIKLKGKNTPRALHTFHREIRTHLLKKSPGYRQPDADTVKLPGEGAVALSEGKKDFFLLVGGDPDTRVLHGKTNPGEILSS